MVNDCRTIRKLIDKREQTFFKQVEKIIVLPLFYTGHQNIDINILNANKLPDGYDIENDHEVNNIEFYTVKSLRVEKCLIRYESPSLKIPYSLHNVSLKYS